jgi:hypothetical protein
MKQEVQEEKKYIIDADVLIKIYNEANPELKPLTRKILADALGVNTQVFTDWKTKNTPKWVYMLFKMMEIGKCNFDKFIIEQKNE